MSRRRRTRLLLTLLLLASFTLITLDYRAGAGSPFDALRNAASAVFGPLERAASAIARPVGDALSSLGHLGSDKNKIDQLQKENAALREQHRLDQVRVERDQELAALYDLTQRGRYTVKQAQVIGVGGGLNFEGTVTIDVGSRDGIRRDMTVLNGDGLVGRVERVGPSTSTVLLLTDKDSTVFVRVAGSLEIGRLDGQGMGNGLRLTLLSQTASLRAGQRLVTLGSTQGPYVPEVPVGVVTRVRRTPGALTRSADVRAYVHFSALDVVGVVVKPPPRVPRDSVLPPSPTPSPTPPATPSPGSSTTPSPGATPSPTP